MFSPLRPALGFDARALTPRVVRRITVVGAETRSYKRTGIVLRETGVAVSIKTIERVLHDVGAELAERRDAPPRQRQGLAQSPDNVPELAVVECDGGRIRCRAPGHGPGVHLAGNGWRESQAACLVRCTRKTFDHDPQPQPPESFTDPRHVARIVATEALSVAAAAPAEAVDEPVDESALQPPPADWRPQRLVRTVLASVADSDAFGKQMQREAKQRRFLEAPAKAFLGDGLPWNWTIHRERFPEFTPILDFIHPLSYLFHAARAVQTQVQDVWDQYVTWMRGCWQGDVEQVLTELRVWQTQLGDPPPDPHDADPRELLRKTIQYLEHNRERMHYPDYRRQGLPITTAWMESLVKELNYRAKGTEMFWNDPEGAEAILQIRAAALCEDDRLTTHLNTRPGSALTRRPKPAKASARKIKS
jgi:hypothetical protein